MTELTADEIATRLQANCLFCGRSGLPEGSYPVLPETLCATHRAEHEADVREWGSSHPDGRCTETCGCESFESIDELFAYLAKETV